MEKREPMVLIACGKKGVGKTVATIEMIYRYISGNPQKGIPPRKALIFDVNDEFSHFWYHGDYLVFTPKWRFVGLDPFGMMEPRWVLMIWEKC